jgi:outer membrane protein assembly factor BamB
VYLVDRDGAVRAFDALSGASAWSVRRSRDLPLDPGQENKVTTGAAIVVVTARRGREVAALDVRDGAVRWAAGFRHGLVDHDGARRRRAIDEDGNAIALDASTGTVRWSQQRPPTKEGRSNGETEKRAAHD